MKNLLQGITIGLLVLLIMVILQSKNQKEIVFQEINQYHPDVPTIPPEYHHREDFWLGYQDGRYGYRRKSGCLEYSRGYDIGLADRHRNCTNYYDHHCPPGFSIRIPGLRLNCAPR